MDGRTQEIRLDSSEIRTNKKFFKDFTLAKLEALDENTRVPFISNYELVVYDTKQKGENYRTATREVEAFFVNAQNGSLLQTKLWPVQMRQSGHPFGTLKHDLSLSVEIGSSFLPMAPS